MDLHNGGLMSMTTWMTRASFLLVASAAALVSACSGSSGAADTEPPAKTSGPPACKSSGKNAWETYGQKAFLAVNSSIFANVDAEMKANGTKNLGNSFNLVGTGKPPATQDVPPVLMGDEDVNLGELTGAVSAHSFSAKAVQANSTPTN